MAVIAVLLSIWARRWARKDSSGIPRSASATSTRPPSSGSVAAASDGRPDRTWLTRSSSRSAAEPAVSSLIGTTHPFPQCPERPELQLLDGPLAPSHQGRDLGHAAVLAKA